MSNGLLSKDLTRKDGTVISNNLFISKLDSIIAKHNAKATESFVSDPYDLGIIAGLEIAKEGIIEVMNLDECPICSTVIVEGDNCPKCNWEVR
jgi:hypothetical protein